ncbi:hypothetical protein [Rubrivivax gelatinosus]|uniref:hypothetical protein n=1 Tax=Rubrivivax gelatinosus TaxID=28068 RepID=UPI0019052C58|nr:hypothetical protein [Rubrivivax gelatinosus]
MARKFIDLLDSNGTAVLVNTSLITRISPTHGTNIDDGVDVIFITFGEPSLAMISVPASKMTPILHAVAESGSKFIDVRAVGGARVFLNAEYISHVTPTHGRDFSDGADLTVFGAQFQVPASAVPAVLKGLEQVG